MVFARDAETCMQHFSSPLFKSSQIIAEDLVVIFKQQAKIRLCKPIATGFTILEASKNFMAWQFYAEIRPRLAALGFSVQVLLSDTDSFLLELTKVSPLTAEEDESGDYLRHLADIFDFSNYPRDHPLYDASRANMLGLWKDEMGSLRLTVYIGLRSKCYSYLVGEGEAAVQTTKLKGIRGGFKQKIPFSKFEDCLHRICKTDVTQYHIRSKSHRVYTLQVRKTAFSSFDDKVSEKTTTRTTNKKTPRTL